MILASQEYSTGNDRLGKLIGNCGMQLIFHPKDDCIDEIAKKFDISRQQLANLEQGEFFAVGGFYSQQHGKNRQAAIRGKAYSATAFLNPDEQEAQDVSDMSSELSGELLLEGTTDLNDDTISETEALSSVQLFLPDLDETERAKISLEAQDIETMQSPGTADLPETESLETVELSTPESEGEPAEDLPEPEEQPTPPESEPEENPQMLIDQELQKQFKCIIHGFNPDNPYLRSVLNDLLAQILEKHLFVNPDERKHLQWQFEFLIANGIPDSPAFREELQELYALLWPAANANS